MQRVIIFAILGLGIIAALVGAAALWANADYRSRMADSEAAYDGVAARAAAASGKFSLDMLEGLPEVARRYFTHAIAIGTQLATTVELTMAGQFLLGEKDNPQQFTMQARQILAPPREFVWLPEMRSGLMEITGSDGLIDGAAWTRFWLARTIPLVQMAATEGLDRSAMARPALEAIWAPASLLPSNGARWQQTGQNSARIGFGEGDTLVELDMEFDADGRVLSVSTLRWSDANPDRTFRLQPFGGTMEAEATFAGYTIPSVVRVGNHYGTPQYFPFFNATITEARYH